MWDLFTYLSTCPSWCSHGAFISEENLLARLAMKWKLWKKERRECFYISNIAEGRGEMKTKKWPWNLATWKSLLIGAILGNWWEESLVRVGDVIFKNLPHCKRWKTISTFLAFQLVTFWYFNSSKPNFLLFPHLRLNCPHNLFFELAELIFHLRHHKAEQVVGLWQWWP